MDNNPCIRHIIVNFSNCRGDILNDTYLLNLYTREATKELRAGKPQGSFFLLNPNGTTVVVLFKNGQLILSTEPNGNYASANLFTVSPDANTHSAIKYLTKTLEAEKTDINEIIQKEISYINALSEEKINQPNNTNSKTSKPATRSNRDTHNLNISILGSSGGVSKSLLSIFNTACNDKKDPIHLFIKSCKLHLIDLKQKDMEYYSKRFPNLKDKISLYQFDANKLERFSEHLKETNTNVVIDISFADTVDMLRCCDSLGILYINSALESLSVDTNEAYAGFPLQERYRIFESHKDEFKNCLSIICSGMNPGIVQWMAIDLMKKYPNERPKACYIIENDTSFFEDEKLVNQDTIYTTWYPEGFLDEAIYSFPTFMKKYNSLFLYKQVYELEFKVSIGKNVFYGCLMPHEEAISLGKMYDMETGFIYKINDHTTKLIKDNLQNIESLWAKPMVVLDPEVAPLKGEDLVGVLLVYDDKEVYMYNSLSNKETYSKYKTNATYLQVAAGLYGALATILLDDLPKKIFYVDELIANTNSNYGKYLNYHLQKFTIGENNFTDGDLLNRMREINKT